MTKQAYAILAKQRNDEFVRKHIYVEAHGGWITKERYNEIKAECGDAEERWQDNTDTAESVYIEVYGQVRGEAEERGQKMTDAGESSQVFSGESSREFWPSWDLHNDRDPRNWLKTGGFTPVGAHKGVNPSRFMYMKNR